MTKLTDKQSYILYIGIGVIVSLIFGILTYLDYSSIQDIKLKIQNENKKIKNFRKKKRKISKLISKLWTMREKYKYFKGVLPTRKDFTKFYNTLDSFRIDRQVPPWKYFKTANVFKENPQEISQTNERNLLSKGKKAKNKKKKKNKFSFEETRYRAAVKMTFSQLGKLLNLIENYKQYYGVESIKISKVSIPPKGGEPQGNVSLTLVSYSYANETPLDKKVKKLLENFQVPPELEKKVRKLKDTEWNKQDPFEWTIPLRDPFDKQKALSIAGIFKQRVNVNIQPPPAPKQLKSSIEKLEKIRNYLHMLAIAKGWMDLQNALIENKYEKELMNLNVTQENDPEGKVKAKLLKMRKELKEWKKDIRKADRKKRARQLVNLGRKKVQQMEQLYKQGKKEGSEKILNKVRTIHNELMPQFREFYDLERTISGLKILRLEMEKLYSRADTQLKIIELAKKLELKGIIYLEDNPLLSIAFINQKMVKKNDILTLGFVVDRIEAKRVVLRYKDETVPISLFKKSNTKKIKNKP